MAIIKKEESMTELNPLEQKGLAIKMIAEEFKVENAVDVVAADKIKKDCIVLEKEIEAGRVTLTKPLLDKKSEIDNFAKSLLIPIAEAKNIIKTKILALSRKTVR